MEQPTDNMTDELLELFPDGDFSCVLDAIPFSSNQEIDTDPLEDLLSLFSSNNDEDMSPDAALGNTATEMSAILTELQPDTLAIDQTRQYDEDPADDETAALAPIAIPQQAIGNQNGLLYQMYAFVFGILAGTMSVTQQPKANTRLRYACDGRRFLPDSRYHPMTISLPNMQPLLLAHNHVMGVVMTMVTNTNNPRQQTLVHGNDISCEEAGAEKLGHGCVFVPIRQFETEKSFRRVSILYKKYEEYTFDLVPFDTDTMFGPRETYTTPDRPNMDNVPKGKRFKRQYNLSAYKFVFHLAVKQDNVVFVSNYTCETHEIDEQVAPTKSRKRCASGSEEALLIEEEASSDSQSSHSLKRFRPSTPPLGELPVTRVSSGSTAPNLGD